MVRPSQLLTTAALILALATALVAQENKARIKQQTPTISGSTGLFNLPTADTLREGEFSFGFHTSKFNREPGDIDITVYPITFTRCPTITLTPLSRRFIACACPWLP